MPWRRAGRVGQRNQVEGALPVPNPNGSSDDFVEFFQGKKLGDREFADGDNELGPEQIDLVVHPRRAVSDFVRRWNAVAAGRGFPRETATDRSEVNFGANLFLGHRAEFLKPAEERAARGPRERSSKNRLLHPGRLTDQHDLAENRPARNRRRHHPWTTATLPKSRDVFRQLLFFPRRTRHCVSAGRRT